MSPVFLPTQPPTSAAHGAGLSTFLSASLLFVWCSPTEI
jgi:hypothetical protein